jgi:hypothetical protein
MGNPLGDLGADLGVGPPLGTQRFAPLLLGQLAPVTHCLQHDEGV